MRIGVDTGGTFTDLVLLDDRQGEGGLRTHKVRSTPEDPAKAILQGIAGLTGGAPPGGVVHGSTVATNAVLERKGARVALLTTRGFEDVVAIGRQTRGKLYDFQVRAPEPMVERSLIFGIAERLDACGEVITPLRLEELQPIIQRLREARIECVAVCFLHAYANPAHERAVQDELHAAGFLVSASHDILPEYREYERWSTTLLNAYVTPIMTRYLLTLEGGLGPTRLHVMQSNGGTLSALRARQAAVRTLLSGPAAGAVGARAIAQASGYARVILFDMGGTSTDVSLMDGELGFTSESVVGDFPVRLPMLDIHTVGAGGGSIAYIDGGGSLRVGPRSAGADPGPVCYGRGEELTVSDADLLLNRLPADFFLGGRMQLDEERTRAHAECVAARLNLTGERLSEGIVEIANANMEHAIRAVSVRRGHDPRDFALLAFGGAGGLHACEIAESMEIGTVLVPRQAGVLSALGMLLADVKKDYSLTLLKPSDALTPEALDAAFAPLLERARAELAQEGFPISQMVLERMLDMRYRGQAYEISVPFTDSFVSEFHARHERLYGYGNSTRSTEVVNLRVNAAGLIDKHSFPAARVRPLGLAAPVRIAKTSFGGEWLDTPVYLQEALLPGMQGKGPAILAGPESTVLITPAFRFAVDGVGTLVATREGAGAPFAQADAFAKEAR